MRFQKKKNWKSEQNDEDLISVEELKNENSEKRSWSFRSEYNDDFFAHFSSTPALTFRRRENLPHTVVNRSFTKEV